MQVFQNPKYEVAFNFVSRPWLLRVTMKNSGKCFYLFVLLAVYVYIFVYMFSERLVFKHHIEKDKDLVYVVDGKGDV